MVTHYTGIFGLNFITRPKSKPTYNTISAKVGLSPSKYLWLDNSLSKYGNAFWHGWCSLLPYQALGFPSMREMDAHAGKPASCYTARETPHCVTLRWFWRVVIGSEPITCLPLPPSRISSIFTKWHVNHWAQCHHQALIQATARVDWPPKLRWVLLILPISTLMTCKLWISLISSSLTFNNKSTLRRFGGAFMVYSFITCSLWCVILPLIYLKPPFYEIGFLGAKEILLIKIPWQQEDFWFEDKCLSKLIFILRFCSSFCPSLCQRLWLLQIARQASASTSCLCAIFGDGWQDVLIIGIGEHSAQYAFTDKALVIVECTGRAEHVANIVLGWHDIRHLFITIC